MKTLNKLSILTITILLSLNGCGGGSSTTGDNKVEQPTVDVTYTLNGKERPTCHNADYTGEINPSPDDVVMCIWNCGRYQGSDTINVTLVFNKPNQTEEEPWELWDEDLKEASPTLCKDI